MLLTSLIFIGVGILLFCSKYLFSFSHKLNLRPLDNSNPDFAVLIPARDESKVIEDLFKSLKGQTHPVNPNSVYIIVESPDDPTVALGEKYHFKTIIRSHPEKQRKGYAISEAVHTILKQKHFDLYFIFDADNTLDRNYFKEMLKTYEKGYDIGIGCRKIKNKTSATSVGSGLIFTIINVLINHSFSRRNLSCIASGTGYYISAKIIDQEKGFPFHTMTEDYEISLYSTIHNYCSFYNEKAIFYDAQPETYSQYFFQRARWEKGYFEARHLYFSQLLRKLRFENPNFASVYNFFVGVYDLVFILIGLILLLLDFTLKSPFYLLIGIISIYFLLILFTAFLLYIEKYHLPLKSKLKTLFFHPLLLLTYVPCLFVVILKRDLAWRRIEH